MQSLVLLPLLVSASFAAPLNVNLPAGLRVPPGKGANGTFPPAPIPTNFPFPSQLPIPSNIPGSMSNLPFPIPTNLPFPLPSKLPVPAGFPHLRPASVSVADTPRLAVRQGAAPPKLALPAGYTKFLFQDDFSTQKAGALPDAAKWTIDVGTSYPGGPANWGTQEIQTYTRSTENLAITPEGSLKITPIRTGEAWTSARIETTAAQDFSCPPGKKIRMEASIKLAQTDAAKQSGIWPAFWSLGAAYRTNFTSWPFIGEIDILEVSNGASVVHHTAHCGVINGGPCKEKSGLSSTAEFPRGRFVKLAAEVDRTNPGGDFAGEKLVWFVDDRQTKVITGKEIGDAAVWEQLARTPKMILLNVAVGGEFPNALSKTGKTPNAQSIGGAPSAMEVKYVAVYST